jgi:hypothetical protein
MSSLLGPLGCCRGVLLVVASLHLDSPCFDFFLFVYPCVASAGYNNVYNYFPLNEIGEGVFAKKNSKHLVMC